MTKEIENAEEIRKLAKRYFKTLKPVDAETNIHIAEIRILGYCELSYIIFNMLKLCILALDQERPEISRTVRNPSIDVSLILEIVAQLLPLHEIEFLDEVHRMFSDDAEKDGEK